MQTNSQSYLNLYLRQSRESTGLMKNLLEYPLLDLIADAESNCFDYEEAEAFYERLALFIGDIGDSPPLSSAIAQEKLYQRELGANILQCGMPQKIVDAIRQIQSYYARKHTISLNVISDDPVLTSIPWELIGNPSIAKMLGLAPFCVARFVDSGQENEDDILAEPADLRFMLVSAQPIDKNSPNPDMEFGEIIRQLDKRKRFPVEIFPYDHSEYLEFVDNLQAINPTALHIALHGTPDGIYFQRGDSYQLIPFSSLIDDIKQVPNLLLIVLSVCYSAYSAEHISSPSFAESLVKTGIPAVIAMASEFTPRAGVEFSKRLYTELSKGHPAIQGFDRAIDTLRNHPNYDSLLWSVPMYYHNANVIPFPTVWKNNSRLKQKPKINLTFISKMQKLSQDAIVVLEELRPNSGWRLEQWDVRAVPFRFLLQQLKSGMSGLENMSNTHDTETMKWIFAIRDKAHETSLALYDIERNLDGVLDESITQRERKDIAEEFDQNRLIVIQCLSELIDVLG